MSAILDSLIEQSQSIGKPQWRPLLEYVAKLHARSTHPAKAPFEYEWEEIGPGYCYGPAFGHWDIVHAAYDAIDAAPRHATHQLLNNLVCQEDDGLVPGTIYMNQTPAKWDHAAGHPPVWQVAVEDLRAAHPKEVSKTRLRHYFRAATRQIGWFENKRKAEGRGFYYTDILNHVWESGVDDGVRFLAPQTGPFACVDATAHVYSLCDHAAKWARRLGEDPSPWRKRVTALRQFMRKRLYSEKTGFFHDIWSVNDPKLRCLTIEGMWPMVVGAATPAQAQTVIDNLIDPAIFCSRHPLTSVAMTDLRFELRMWRGPAWNSMTFWAAKGCHRYGRPDAAAILLERAIDCSAHWFDRTNTIWEFYHPHGDSPKKVARKPYSPYNMPCRDYLGHNPLIAMALLWETCVAPVPRKRRTLAPAI